MRDSAPQRLTERHQAVLRQASAALRGRLVTLWRMASGCAVAEAASESDRQLDMIDIDVAGTLQTWGRAVSEGSLWIVCCLAPGRWHVAPVRRDVPAPPPHGVERRSPERLILELAGLLLGALDRVWAVADQATVFLCTALAVIEVSLGRVQEARGLSTATRAHLLADLAIISQAIESALGAA